MSMRLTHPLAHTIRIAQSADGLRLTSPYDGVFVAAFKAAIPANARRWDGASKQWLIDPAHGQKLVQVVQQHFGLTLELPSAASAGTTPETTLIQLAYLGRCKAREDGSSSASGYLLGNRNPKAPDVIAPESVLKGWFEGASSGQSTPAPADSLYAVLCVAPSCDSATLKAAYRRMARQTHPDINKEPDATAQFQAIQHAYSILSDEKQRRKYDAGLILAARANTEIATRSVYAYADYRSALRCGLLLVTGQRSLGRLTLQTIHSWQDLQQGNQILVSSWPQGAEHWREEWVTT